MKFLWGEDYNRNLVQVHNPKSNLAATPRRNTTTTTCFTFDKKLNKIYVMYISATVRLNFYCAGVA